MILAAAILFLAALPAREARLYQQAGIAKVVLANSGISPEASAPALAVFAPTALAIEIVVMGLYLLNAMLIYRMRSHDWQALISAAALAAFAVHITPTLNAWMMANPDLAPLGSLMKGIGLGLAFLFLYLFPGRYFAPEWMRYFVYAWIIWTGLWLVYPGSIFDFRDPYSIRGAGFYALMVWWVVAVFTQIYRYRYVSSILEKQQSKYVFFGATFVFVGYIVYILLRNLLSSLSEPDMAITLYGMIAPYVFLVMVAIIPVTITFSILRYRLFDIDLIIRRTLVYTGLTGLLAVMYFSSVVLLQTLFAAIGEAQSPTVVVLSTLGIAALFNPLRRRLQDGIDRRFYRSKYDAELALARFEEQVRDEVDLDRLCAHLTDVIGETMQPVDITIWLGVDRQKSKSSQGAG